MGLGTVVLGNIGLAGSSKALRVNTSLLQTVMYSNVGIVIVASNNFLILEVHGLY